jgi:hypothetical protein
VRIRLNRCIPNDTAGFRVYREVCDSCIVANPEVMPI